MSAKRSTAESYHELTNYTHETLRRVSAPDPGQQPAPFKEVVSSQRVPLRAYLPFGKDPFTGEPLDPAPPSDEGDLGLAVLSRLLFHTNGITGVVQFEGGGGHMLRAAPSAGALYPSELYLVAPPLPELEAGIYHYQVARHELVRLWEGDHTDAVRRALGSQAFPDTRAFLLLSGVFWRSAWRYGERGYRRVLLDAGHVLGNLAAYAPAEGWTAVPAAGFNDAALNGLLFLDDAQEAVLLCMPILREESVPRPSRLLRSSVTLGKADGSPSVSWPEALAASATVALHRASCCEADAALVEAGAGAAPSDGALPLTPPTRRRPVHAGRAILRRRSARSYSGEAIGLQPLTLCLDSTFCRSAPDAAECWFPVRRSGLLDSKLVALRVEGLAPGIYGIEGAGEALLPLSLGDFGERFFEATLAQEIARDCAAAVAFTAPLHAAVERWGERAYRYLHLEAGHLGERLQIAATSARLSCCGIAGFLDEEAAGLLALEPDEITLYFVTLGRE